MCNNGLLAGVTRRNMRSMCCLAAEQGVGRVSGNGLVVELGDLSGCGGKG